MTIKIYVASLEAYNAGEMVGNWVTPSDYEDYDKFRWAIMDATKYADEVAVHDYDGINLSNEYPDFEKLYEFCKALEDSHIDKEVITAYADNMHSELTPELIDEVEENYINTYDTFQEFANQEAEQEIENTVNREAVQFVFNNFDYEGYARDIRHSYTVLDLPDYSVAVFRTW
tara:strand:+ start:13 stop:531 length:519 start_codon:yes stop_codon:yes gene_type:complete